MRGHFNCYFDEECVESADIELCVPIKKEIDNKAIRCKILPQVKALRTTPVSYTHLDVYKRQNLY